MSRPIAAEGTIKLSKPAALAVPVQPDVATTNHDAMVIMMAYRIRGSIDRLRMVAPFVKIFQRPGDQPRASDVAAGSETHAMGERGWMEEVSGEKFNDLYIQLFPPMRRWHSWWPGTRLAVAD
jgi:hypothetical protein